MKRTQILIAFLTLLLWGCNFGESQSTYVLSGQIQKGPFVSGSTIKIQELDSSLSPTGLTYETTTNDDFGSFSISSKLTSSLVEVIATGYYFNEVSGTLSDGPLTLRAITNLANSSIVNVNILTTLQINRLKKLVSNGSTLDEAIIQSEGDVLSVFNINEASSTFTAMDISKEGNQNAILLAISSIMQSTNTVAQLSELISHLGLALSQTGSITDEQLIVKLKDNSYNLDLQRVRTNLLNRYNNLGLSVTIPEFENYSLLLNTKKPAVVSVTPSSSSTTKIPGQIVKATFSQKMNASTIDINSFIVKNGSLPIQGTVNYDSVTLIASFSPTDLLVDGASYTILLSDTIKDFAGNNLESEYSWTFSVSYIKDVYIKWSAQGTNNYPNDYYERFKILDLNHIQIVGIKNYLAYDGIIDFSRVDEGEHVYYNEYMITITRKEGVPYITIVNHDGGYGVDTINYIDISKIELSNLLLPSQIQSYATNVYPWNGTWGTYMYTGFDQIWP